MTSNELTHHHNPAHTQSGASRRAQGRRLPLNRNVIIVVGLMLLGLALRAWFLSVNAIDPRFSTADDGDYYQRALRFAMTGQYVDDFWLIRPPLHVFLFAFLLRVSAALGDLTQGLLLIRAVQIGLFLCTIPLGYDIARRLFNPRAGLIVAALLAIWFPLVELPIHTFSEPLFFFFFIIQLWLLLVWRAARHWPWLAAAGVTLGLAALTRAPALYAAAFVLLWLLLETLDEWLRPAGAGAPVQRHGLGNRVARLWEAIRATWTTLAWRGLVFGLAMGLTVAPWTIRNYLVYERFIPIDTLGPANLWLDMQPDRREKIELLKTIPQADRQAFAVDALGEILREDPLRIWHDAWPNFQHIWKAQFVEDFLFKPNFYTRPLRETWPLGLSGDLLWFGFTISGLAALARPLREGPFRWLLLCWLGYTVLTVLLLHVEPRYLMPIWLVLILYAAWAWSNPAALLDDLRRHRLHGAVALLLVAAFLAIFFSYRNYPEALARGVQREWYHLAGSRAEAAEDYPTAVAAYRRMVAVDPRSIDGRVDLARVLLAQGEPTVALDVLGNNPATRATVVRAAIAREQGHHSLAAELFAEAARWQGEDIQSLTRAWLQPPPTQHLSLGNGLDYGYIQGFSFGEELPGDGITPVTYRWLQGRGRIVLPLPQPLQAGSRVTLRMAGGQAGGTPLQLRFADCPAARCEPVSLTVSAGAWRTYQLIVPPALAGRQHLDLLLTAPTFIPAHQDTGSSDMRPLSLMISSVRAQHPASPDDRVSPPAGFFVPDVVASGHNIRNKKENSFFPHGFGF